jgi:hypothetical protein
VVIGAAASLVLRHALIDARLLVAPLRGELQGHERQSASTSAKSLAANAH